MKKRILFTYSGSSILLFFLQAIIPPIDPENLTLSIKYGWLIPFIGGVLLIGLDSFLGTLTNRLGCCLYHLGLVSFIVGFILERLLDLLHTTSPYITFYPLSVMILLGLSFFVFITTWLMKE